MSKNIIKSSSTKKVKPFDFQYFVKADRGLKEFSLGKFSDSKIESSGEGELNKAVTKLDSAESSSKIVDEKKIYDRGFDDGYKKGYMDGELSSKKQYQAQKDDYLDILKSGIERCVDEIKPIKNAIDELDQQLPDMVLSFVREIVGFETVLNDKLIVSNIKNVIDKIRQYTEVSLMVSSQDLNLVKDLNTGYDVVCDNSLGKGDLKVKTNIGIMDFSLKTLLNELKERLDEEFKNSKQG